MDALLRVRMHVIPVESESVRLALVCRRHIAERSYLANLALCASGSYGGRLSTAASTNMHVYGRVSGYRS